MKVLLVNGSAHRSGTTYAALKEASIVLNIEGIETDIFQLGNPEIRDCSGCGACRQLGKCVFNDVVNTFVEQAAEYDAFIFGTPVYYAHPSGRLLSFLDRAFYSGARAFSYKPAAAVAAARRSGTTASFDVLNKYFSISNMPIAPSTYWNMTHGSTPEDVLKDKEGLQTMRNLAKNIVFMIKAFSEAKDKYGLPNIEKTERTSFPDGK